MLIAFIILSIGHFSKKGIRLPLITLFAGVIASCVVYLADFSFENLKPHQKDRINVWLNPSQCDPQGSLYNLNQSKLAIGSGGVKGKGIFHGDLTAGNHVPGGASVIDHNKSLPGNTLLLVIDSILLANLSRSVSKKGNLTLSLETTISPGVRNLRIRM